MQKNCKWFGSTLNPPKSQINLPRNCVKERKWVEAMLYVHFVRSDPILQMKKYVDTCVDLEMFSSHQDWRGLPPLTTFVDGQTIANLCLFDRKEEALTLLDSFLSQNIGQDNIRQTDSQSTRLNYFV